MAEHVAQVVTERTGVRWLPAYGASEVPVIAANPVDRPEQWRLDSAGLPPEGVSLRVAAIAASAGIPLAVNAINAMLIRRRDRRFNAARSSCGGGAGVSDKNRIA